MTNVATNWLGILSAPAPAAPAKKPRAPKRPLATTKTDKGREICQEMYADPSNVPRRANVLSRLEIDAKMTPASAASFLENWRNTNTIAPR